MDKMMICCYQLLDLSFRFLYAFIVLGFCIFFGQNIWSVLLKVTIIGKINEITIIESYEVKEQTMQPCSRCTHTESVSSFFRECLIYIRVTFEPRWEHRCPIYIQLHLSPELFQVTIGQKRTQSSQDNLLYGVELGTTVLMFVTNSENR